MAVDINNQFATGKKFLSLEPGSDMWWYGGNQIAWASKQEAFDNIPEGKRPGLTIGILESGKVVEYIWHEDVSELGLKLKLEVTKTTAEIDLEGDNAIPNVKYISDKLSAIPNTDTVYDDTEVVKHLNNVVPNPHNIGPADLSLENVDNTADADKPVSTAQQTALNTKQDTLVSGTDIKTINGETLLGEGNLEIAESTIESTLPDTLEMAVAVGGLAAGTPLSELKGLTFTEYILKQNFPTVPASYTNSYLTSSGFVTTAVEVGTTYGFTLGVVFNKGNIENGDGSSAGFLSGDLRTLNVSTPGNPTAAVALDGTITGNSWNSPIPSFTIAKGDVNTVVISGTNHVGTTTYTDNKAGTAIVPAIESAKLDTTPTNLTLNKRGLYYLYEYRGAQGSTPMVSADIKNSPGITRTFLGVNDTKSYEVEVLNTPVFTLYTIAGKTVSIVDKSTNSPMVDGAPQQVAITDATGVTTADYDVYIVDMGLNGLGGDTTFIISIT